MTAELLSQTAETPKASTYAPASDLLAQVDFFVNRVTQSLADPNDFDLAKQARTLKDGNTLAALGLVLAKHDEEFPAKRAMPALVKAAQKLAACDDKVEPALQALAEIKQARAGQATTEMAVDWQRVASLPALMKQVPLVHSGLKRNVEGNRLARQAAPAAAQAAALAAIAQASLFDTQDLKKPEDAAAWRECCALMRDAAGEVNFAVHAQDAARVSAGMKRLAQSCEVCHAKFRHE